ncbi:hypothetical protein GJ744_010169 [Endocarpon pusillum]|uniref:NADH dehydrogenase [ubiquinone] 1 alpha subcomplex subunit 1 n=1 Tax=Endocarpon pusillum TaxID=364733 RepID=A0A8H7AMD8_9EURO|nr:hypothetical protein GJ744_010169 [Endocarpon pusillum]
MRFKKNLWQRLSGAALPPAGIPTAQLNHPPNRIHHPVVSPMGVPFEALLPYGIMLAMFGVTGAGLSTVRYYSNNKKAPRRTLDAWDRQMMDRDFRLTGIWREQTDNPVAPVGFEVNNPWRMEKRII